jgi:aspartate/tyrosine/aromatic aminotransferase
MGARRLVPRSDFNAVPGAGQSELIFTPNIFPNTSIIGWTNSILVMVNGGGAAHIMADETAKVIVNNGSVFVEAQTYYVHSNAINKHGAEIYNRFYGT